MIKVGALFASVLAFALSLLGQGAPPRLVDDSTSFRVHPEIRFQTITGFGAGVYPGPFSDIGDLHAAQLEKMYSLLYGEDGPRLNIVRLDISWGARPMAQAASGNLHYDWDEDPITQSIWKSVAQSLQHIAHPIVYAVPFTPPVQWKTEQRPNWGGRLQPEHYADYADYLADFVRYYKTVHGVTINVISLQNEPDIAAPWDSCRWTGAELHDFARVAGEIFRRQGLRTTIMAPEGSSWDQSWIHAAPILGDPKSRAYIGILASHSYGDDDLVDAGRAPMRSASERYRLPLWTSEMSLIGKPDDASIQTGLKVAHVMYRDLVEANVSAWIYCFTIFDAQFPGSMGILSPIKEGKLVIPKRFWTFSNFSHFVRPGWRRIDVQGLAFSNAAFVSPDEKEFVIVALNASGNWRPARYDFGNYNIKDVSTYRTSADSDLARVDSPTAQQHSFTTMIAPMSVTTFIGELSNSQ
ncbi:MAG: glycoside hydrolase [Methanoregula sp.]